MSDLIRGKDVLVEVYDDGFWKPYACGTDCSLEVTTDFIETSQKGDGKYASFRPTKISFTGSIAGLTDLAGVNTLSLADLRAKQLGLEKLRMRFDRTGVSGTNTYIDEAFFYISNSSDSGPNGGMNSFTIGLRGTGAITQIFVPTIVNPNSKVKSLYINKTGSETGFTNFIPPGSALVNKDIVGAWRQTDIMPITTGTPSAKEIKYTIASGRFDWTIPLESDEIIHVQYQDI